MATPQLQPPSPARPAEASARQRLIEGATRAFSRLGYEAATTRMIADEAGVNLAAIPYYFGTKEALYAEVVSHLSLAITARMSPRMDEIRRVLEVPAEPAACLDALGYLVDTHVETVMGEDMILAAPILAREQASPSAVFPQLFAQTIRPQLDLASALIARILHQSEESPEVRVKAYALLGMSVHIAYARQSFLHYVGDALAEPCEQQRIRGWIRDLVCRSLGTCPGQN